MFEKLKKLKDYFTGAGVRPIARDALDFPRERLERRGSRGEKLHIMLPMAAWLVDSLKVKHPALLHDMNETWTKESPQKAVELLVERLGADQPEKDAGLEVTALELLIWSEKGDVLRDIQSKFPDAYTAARADSVGNPIRFTVNLLEAFGIASRQFPECYDALKVAIVAKPAIAQHPQI